MSLETPLKSVDKFLIGMNHMPPVSEGLKAWIYSAERNAASLAENGITSMIIENDGDKDIVANPRFVNDAGRLASVVDYMVKAGQKLRNDYGQSIFIGIQILWNYGNSMKVAKEIEADFIRSQIYCEERVSPTGLVLEPTCFRIHYFKQENPSDISVLADIDSKGTRPVGDYSRAQSISNLFRTKYVPTALVVTGAATGEAPTVESVNDFCSIVDEQSEGFPFGGGSGLTVRNIELLTCTRAKFWIVGSSIKSEGFIDPIKVRDLTTALYAGVK